MSFDRNLEAFGDRTCLIAASGEKLTYKQIAAACDALADTMPPKKQLIIIRASNTIETLVGYLTFLRRGDAVMMLDASLDWESLDAIYRLYRPNLIWESGSTDCRVSAKYGDYVLCQRYTETVPMHPELALMLSTSGSTGTPKMVKLSKRNLAANCESIVGYLPIEKDDIAITNLPLHYSYGLSILHTHLHAGAGIVVTDTSVMTQGFWELMKSYDVCTLQGVPYHYEIFRRIGLMKKALPSLRYLTQAGGKLNPKLVKIYAQWAAETGKTFYVMYGQTEATARISYLPPEAALDKSGSIGIPIPGGSLELRDTETGEEITEAHHEGELIYHGPNVMMGYAETLEDLAMDDVCRGVLPTGDIACRDKDGYYYITGRIKRFVKMFGNRISLDAIEHWLKERGFDVQCTGRDNHLMIATNRAEDVDAVKKEVLDRFGLHHTSVRVMLLSEYPASESGKINYGKIMEMFDEA